MFMLDTDTCSYIIKQRPISVLEKFKHLDSKKICISIITYAELLYGVERSNSKKNNHEVVENFTSRLVIIDWDLAAAKRYSVLRAHMESSGKIIGNMNLMIASHALSINAHVITNNTRHFSLVPGLKMANWVTN